MGSRAAGGPALLLSFSLARTPTPAPPMLSASKSHLLQRGWFTSHPAEQQPFFLLQEGPVHCDMYQSSGPQPIGLGCFWWPSGQSTLQAAVEAQRVCCQHTSGSERFYSRDKAAGQELPEPGEPWEGAQVWASEAEPEMGGSRESRVPVRGAALQGHDSGSPRL